MTRTKPLFLLLAALLMWQPVSAQSNDWGLPPSPRGKLAAALLDAINNDNPDVHRQFIEAHFTPAYQNKQPMESHLKLFSRLHQDLAGAEVNGVDMMMGQTIILGLLMRSEAGEYTKLNVNLNQDNPPRIDGLMAEAASEPPTERMISALLEAINASDPEAHQAFVETYFAPAFRDELPMETHLNLFQQLHRDLAGAEVGEVNAMARGGSDETVAMTMKAKSGDRYTLTFDIQMSSPPRLITLSVQPQ